MNYYIMEKVINIWYIYIYPHYIGDIIGEMRDIWFFL